MTALLESPWPALIGAMLLALMLGAGWMQTGRQSLLAFAAAALVVGALLVLIERLIETDREKVTATVRELAAAVERNDVKTVVDMIHEGAPEVRDRAANEMPQYSFQRVSVKSNLQVDVQADREPPRAVATFNVVVELVQHPRPIPRYVELTFYRTSTGEWRMYNYRHSDFQRGFQQPGGAGR